MKRGEWWNDKELNVKKKVELEVKGKIGDTGEFKEFL